MRRAARWSWCSSQKPYPAFALDRHWNIVATNHAMPQLFAGVDDALRAPPMNALRVSLHPRGLAPRIENLAEWRAHLLSRLRRQVALTADPVLARLLEECAGYPGGEAPAAEPHGVLVPLRLRAAGATLSFFSTTTVFGSPVDVTLSELAVEMFFPADEPTDRAVRLGAATN